MGSRSCGRGLKRQGIGNREQGTVEKPACRSGFAGLESTLLLCPAIAPADFDWHTDLSALDLFLNSLDFALTAISWLAGDGVNRPAPCGPGSAEPDAASGARPMRRHRDIRGRLHPVAAATAPGAAATLQIEKLSGKSSSYGMMPCSVAAFVRIAASRAGRRARSSRAPWPPGPWRHKLKPSRACEAGS